MLLQRRAGHEEGPKLTLAPSFRPVVEDKGTKERRSFRWRRKLLRAVDRSISKRTESDNGKGGNLLGNASDGDDQEKEIGLGLRLQVFFSLSLFCFFFPFLVLSLSLSTFTLCFFLFFPPMFFLSFCFCLAFFSLLFWFLLFSLFFHAKKGKKTK